MLKQSSSHVVQAHLYSMYIRWKRATFNLRATWNTNHSLLYNKLHISLYLNSCLKFHEKMSNSNVVKWQVKRKKNFLMRKWFKSLVKKPSTWKLQNVLPLFSCHYILKLRMTEWSQQGYLLSQMWLPNATLSLFFLFSAIFYFNLLLFLSRYLSKTNNEYPHNTLLPLPLSISCWFVISFVWWTSCPLPKRHNCILRGTDYARLN